MKQNSTIIILQKLRLSQSYQVSILRHFLIYWLFDRFEGKIVLHNSILKDFEYINDYFDVQRKITERFQKPQKST